MKIKIIKYTIMILLLLALLGFILPYLISAKSTVLVLFGVLIAVISVVLLIIYAVNYKTKDILK